MKSLQQPKTANAEFSFTVLNSKLDRAELRMIVLLLSGPIYVARSATFSRSANAKLE